MQALAGSLNQKILQQHCLQSKKREGARSKELAAVTSRAREIARSALQLSESEVDDLVSDEVQAPADSQRTSCQGTSFIDHVANLTATKVTYSCCVHSQNLSQKYNYWWPLIYLCLHFFPATFC